MSKTKKIKKEDIEGALGARQSQLAQLQDGRQRMALYFGAIPKLFRTPDESDLLKNAKKLLHDTGVRLDELRNMSKEILG